MEQEIWKRLEEISKYKPLTIQDFKDYSKSGQRRGYITEGKRSEEYYTGAIHISYESGTSHAMLCLG